MQESSTQSSTLLTMKKYFLILLFVSFAFSESPAQTATPKLVQLTNTMGDVFQASFSIRPEGRYRTIKGSPYLFEDWHPGIVAVQNDSTRVHLPMRYNVYGNEMQFIANQDTFAVANPLILDFISIDDRRFEYLAFNRSNDNSNMAYFEILNEGGFRLLKRFETKIIDGRDPVTPYHPQNDNDRFVLHSSLYLQTPDNPEPIGIPGAKIKWLELAGPNRDKLNVFIKSNRIKINKEKDLLKIIRFLNEFNGEI